MHKLYMNWLQDAYGMERSVLNMLQSQAKTADPYPRIKKRIEKHIQETQRHADLMHNAIERNGGKPSVTKSKLAAIVGALEGPATKAFKDKMTKIALADFAAEHFEIASYRALRAAAKELGDKETVKACDRILKDEERMAAFMDRNLPGVIKKTLQQPAH